VTIDFEEDDVQYVLMLHAEPTGGMVGEPQEWVDYTQALSDAGVLVAGEALQPPDSATTVRVRDGERLLTDGPFVETKELLIGFYLIEVDGLDDALDWSARLPGVDRLTVDVRPVLLGPASAQLLQGRTAG
jgi:hypothetical protein